MTDTSEHEPVFRLRRLLSPGFLIRRLRSIESPGDFVVRLRNIFRYLEARIGDRVRRSRRNVSPSSVRRPRPRELARTRPREKSGGLNVVLIQAPAWGVACPPYGIAVLKSYLARQGHRVRAMDLNIRLFLAASPSLREQWEPSRHQFWMQAALVRDAFEGELSAEVEKIVDDILDEDPDVVGFSALYSNEQASLLLASRIKEVRPGCLVVFGGPQASKDAGGRKLVLSGVVDFAVEGEGELVFSEFLKRLSEERDVREIPGLMFEREGRAADTGLHPLASDIASLPFPDYSDFPMDRYEQVGCLPASLSRGCPNQCVFCYEVQYWKSFRARKADSLVQEIAHLKNTLGAVNDLWFHDSLINGNMGELKKFARGLIDSGANIRWHSQAVIRKEMTRDVLRLLRDSGCYCLNYGLESASFSTMLKMGKVLAKGSDVDAIVRDTAEAGIDCILNFMFGFPGETEEDFQASLDFVRRNKDYISMVQPSPGFCDFYEGTEGYKHPEKFDIVLREGSAHWNSKDGTNTYLTRMERFERFLEVVHGLGIKCSYPYRTVYLKNTIIGNYHFGYGRFDEAIPFLEKAMDTEPANGIVAARLEDCYWRTRRPWRAVGTMMRRRSNGRSA